MPLIVRIQPTIGDHAMHVCLVGQALTMALEHQDGSQGELPMAFELGDHLANTLDQFLHRCPRLLDPLLGEALREAEHQVMMAGRQKPLLHLHLPVHLVLSTADRATASVAGVVHHRVGSAIFALEDPTPFGGGSALQEVLQVIGFFWRCCDFATTAQSCQHLG